MDAELDLLRSRYVQKLNELYGGELELLNMLPVMAEMARAPSLRSALQYHLEKTREHVQRLRHIFGELRQPPVNFTPHHQEALRLEDESAETDAVLIAAARKMERHEIFDYLFALNCAQILRYDGAVEVLQQTLNEEYEADQILADLAEATSSVNPGPTGSRMWLRWPASEAAETDLRRRDRFE